MMILFYFHEYDQFFKSSKLLSLLSIFSGAISYSVYLFHYAVIVIINYSLDFRDFNPAHRIYRIAYRAFVFPSDKFREAYPPRSPQLQRFAPIGNFRTPLI